MSTRLSGQFLTVSVPYEADFAPGPCGELVQVVDFDKAAKTLPRSLAQPAVAALLDVVDRDHESTRRTDWPERDLALILTGLLAGLRADELRRADVGDIRRSTEGGAVLHVRGKGSKDRACRSRPTCYR